MLSERPARGEISVTPDPQIAALRAEIRQLQAGRTQDRVSVAVVAVMALGALAYTYLHQQKAPAALPLPLPQEEPEAGPTTPLVTRSLTVVDERGKTRFLVNAERAGTFLRIVDANGEPRAALDATESGSLLVLTSGKASMALHVDDQTPSVNMSDARGMRRIVVKGGETPSVRVFRPDGKEEEVLLGIDAKGPRLKLIDPATGKVLFEKP